MDFRMNAKRELFFLEVNFVCSVFYQDGYEGSADYVLKYDGIGQAGFLRKIIDEGIARHRRKQKKYVMKGNSIAGYGIYAAENIKAREIVFKGEGASQRIVTRKHVLETWNKREQEVFRRYAYPLSREVFFLWDTNPASWAPQNHSCDPNTEYEGLDVIASRHIRKGEELTLNYATFLDEHMEPFVCNCGSINCNKLITGVPGNSVTAREEIEV
jgi:D-alanine-D-alanine ligase